MTRAAAALAALLVTGAPALVSAETPLEQAKALVARATVEYQVGHFDQALVLYSKAYELLPKPELLFDIGQCHRMLKDHERAIFFYQGYLRAKPDAANRSLVEGFLAESTRELDTRRAAEAEKRAEEERLAAERAAAAGTAATAAPAPTGVTPGDTAAAPDPSARRASTLRIAGLATGGLGVVLLGTATYFGLHAASLSHDIAGVSSQRGTWSSSDQSQYDGGRTDAAAASVLFVAGGLALAGGAVLTYLGWPRRGSDAGAAVTAFAVVPARGGGTLGIAAGF